MNQDPSKLRQIEQEQSQSATHLEHAEASREFGSVEEMIRFDAAQNPVPEKLSARVKESTAQELPPVAWWRRLFSRKS